MPPTRFDEICDLLAGDLTDFAMSRSQLPWGISLPDFKRTPAYFHALPHHRKLFQPLNPTSVGEFRRMSAGELGTIETGCAHGMEVLGYPFTTSRPAHWQTALLSDCHGLGFLMDRFRYYRWNPRSSRCLVRWKIPMRVRARYIRLLGFARKDW